jgi:Uma2 family endonuclease
MVTARITWQDAQLMPEDGKRYEAIDGELYVTAAPTPRHQRIVHALDVELHQLLEVPSHGRVYPAPVGVAFADSEEGVQPDLIFIATERLEIIGATEIHGAPDLVVEILSPSTADRDRTIKRKLYQRQGAGEYWIVDPAEESVEVWTATATTPDRYSDRLPVWAGGKIVGEIDLISLFQQ